MAGTVAMPHEARGLLLELVRIGSLLAEMEWAREAVENLSGELHAALRSLRQAARLVERRSQPRPALGGHVLTDRERAIAASLAAGKSYKDVAVAFGMTVASAQSRVRAIYVKLGVHSKSELRTLFARHSVRPARTEAAPGPVATGAPGTGRACP